MTINDIADYCQIKDCEVTVGDPAVGFVRVNGRGLVKTSNYNRFRSLNELASTPSAKDVIEQASVFRVRGDGEEKSYSREDFESDYRRFLALIGA